MHLGDSRPWRTLQVGEMPPVVLLQLGAVSSSPKARTPQFNHTIVVPCTRWASRGPHFVANRPRGVPSKFTTLFVLLWILRHERMKPDRETANVCLIRRYVHTICS